MKWLPLEAPGCSKSFCAFKIAENLMALFPMYNLNDEKNHPYCPIR